jgi:uncharacterized protein YdeI (BOF family)
VASLPNEPYANYFYLTDESGGIQIYSYKKTFPTLKLGDQIKVFGDISTSQGIPRVRISSAGSITRFGSTLELKPEQKNIIDVDESDFGKLLTLEGEITDLNSASFYLDDTSGEAYVNLPVKSGVNKKDLVPGSRISITGIVEKRLDSWRITPRTKDDIKQVSMPAISNKVATSPTKKATAAGGGLLLIGLAAVIKRWITKI